MRSTEATESTGLNQFRVRTEDFTAALILWGLFFTVSQELRKASEPEK